MTLNQLRYFCTASRCHSITKAAEELYVTQPTVSVAIRDLEIEFGISLFYRKGNRLILTEEGEELYNKATYILQYCRLLQYGESKAPSSYRNSAYAEHRLFS
jgi:DNA-binding transcriptional LysR family regulator